MKLNLTFRTVVIGEPFECNGNLYKKKSTRTAECLANGKVFYFGQHDNCKVVGHWQTLYWLKLATNP